MARLMAIAWAFVMMGAVLVPFGASAEEKYHVPRDAKGRVQTINGHSPWVRKDANGNLVYFGWGKCKQVMDPSACAWDYKNNKDRH